MKSKPARIFSTETLRILVLILACVLIWCFVQDRWSAAAWGVPVEYTADYGAMDVISVFAAIKSAGNGYLIPFLPKMNPDLGAPFIANWNDYPGNDQLQVFLCGLLADTVGLFQAANLTLMLVHVLAALAFYLACRSLKCAWPWAFAGAIVFGFEQFAFAHGQHHLTLSSYWHIPLCLLVCRWASTGSGLRWNDPRYRIALLVAFLAGIQNVYYASMFIQLLGIACVIQFARRRWTAILTALSVGTASFATYLLMNVNTFIYHFQHGQNYAAVSRKYWEIEYTGLKFVDFFMPWQHRIPGVEEWSGRYHLDNWVHGEIPPGSYFGVIGIIALAWLAVVSFRKFIGRPARPLPLEALQIFWIFIFSTVGGVNGLVGNFGFLLFRATTRYSIFILCIVLTFMMRRLSAATSRNQPALVAALPLLVAVAALWDQLPMVKTRDDLRLNAALSNSDRVFTVAMEKRLPDKAMVFQLPITDFPESYSGHLPSYDHFRPYLYSEHLRFSFGSDKGRPRADWQHQIGGPVRDIVTALERYGFAAVYVNRMAFKNKANDLIGDFAEAGRSEFIKSPLGDLVCVVLHPSEHPVLPPLGAAQPVK